MISWLEYLAYFTDPSTSLHFFLQCYYDTLQMHREARMKDALCLLQRKIATRIPSWEQESQKPEVEKWLESVYKGMFVYIILQQ